MEHEDTGCAQMLLSGGGAVAVPAEGAAAQCDTGMEEPPPPGRWKSLEGTGLCDHAPADPRVALLVVAWLFARRLLPRVLALLLLLVALEAHAIDVGSIASLEGGRYVALREAQIGAPWTPRLTLLADHATTPVVVATQDRVIPLVRSVSTAELSASLAIRDYVRVGVALPIHAVDSVPDVVGRGDTAFFVAVPLGGGWSAVSSMSFGGNTGPWYAAPSGTLAMSGGVDRGPWHALGEVGVRVQQPVELPGGITWGARVEFGAGAQWDPGPLAVGSEWRGSFPLDGIGQWVPGQYPLETLATVGAPLGPLRGTLVGGVGIFRGLGTPGFRLGVRVEADFGIEDTDADGITDLVDLCRRRPEDRDEFRDGDGCPDEDDDEDGIVDALDACRLEAEVYNDWRDEDGCPDALARVTLRVTAGDQVPELAEVEVDSRVVKVMAGDPAAIEVPPGKQAFVVRADGYEPRTEDRVLPEGPSLQRFDLAPTEEAPPLAPAEDPCAAPIGFALDDHHLDAAGVARVAELASWLDAHREVRLFRIEGRADGLGSSAYNYDLSVLRATAVQDALVAAGVADVRLDAIGSGEASSTDRAVLLRVLVWDDRTESPTFAGLCGWQTEQRATP